MIFEHNSPHVATAARRWTAGVPGRITALVLLILGVAGAAPAAAQRKVERAEVEVTRTQAWPEAVVEAFGQLP
ncbi:MAG: hypothetical protein P8R43_03750, partial [Planctomycetota bacterium]|nr:hypothetical protein [Planctomycetota bacterium]